MGTPSPLEKLRRRYSRLAARLSRIGLIAQGTITERTIELEDKDRPGQTRSYGPYYQWTFKEKGKTVTVNLSKAQVACFRRAIQNQRRMEDTMTKMREVSLRILESTTKGVEKRKPRA